MTAAAEFLIERGGNVTRHDLHGDTALHLAAVDGNLELVRMLVESGAKPETKNAFGNTPLHLASLNGHLDVVKYLSG